MTWITLALLFSCLACMCCSENDTFVATKEWQEIKPGQRIPPGLHVRINLETGKKEAKLLDSNSNESNNIFATETPSETKEKKLEISKTISDALKSLPKISLGIEYNPVKLEQMKNHYKTLDELKRSFRDMKMDFKTDAEIIRELIKEYKNMTKEESNQADLVRILDNFNYLVHQIDNAIWFIDEGGLDFVLLPTIVNNTNTALRVQSMRVLGALTQNNPKAKISVYEKNFGSHLSHILITSASTDELSAALYAFGSLLRKFPHAQMNILSRSGVRALITILNKDCEMKIKAKAITLISDLITEKDFAVANAVENDASLYFELNLEGWLNANEFCQTVDAALSSKKNDLIEQPDILEYFVQALEITEPICRHIWTQSTQLRHTLLVVMNRFYQSKNEYRLEMAKSIDKLLSLLFKTTTVQVRDEL